MEIDEEALTEEDLLVSVYIGLVTIEAESSILRLVHFTTRSISNALELPISRS